MDFYRKVEALRQINISKANEAKKRQAEIENEKRRKINQYEQRLKEKDEKIKQFQSKRHLRRISQTSSPGIRHVQSQQNLEENNLLDQIEERCRQAQHQKLKTIKRRTSIAQKKNIETQKRLEEYYKSEENIKKSKAKKFLLNRLDLEKQLNKHAKNTLLEHEQMKLRNKMKRESSNHNRKGHTLNAEDRLGELMKKLKHSEENIQKCK